MTSGDELRQIWNAQTNSKELKGGEEMLAMVIEKTRTLDRQVAIRNTRELIAGLAAAALFGWNALNAPSPLERIGMIVVALTAVWATYYLLRFGGGPRRLEPGAQLIAYRDVLRESYDRQIRLMRTVKYWAILPAYAGVLISDIGMRIRLAAEGKSLNFTRMGILTAIFAAYWIVNETYALPRLARRRQELLAADEN